jgi:hypothetical protein
MSGKIVGIAIMIIALAVGAGIYYFQVYGYYTEISDAQQRGVALTSLSTGTPEPILATGITAIDAGSSPIRYRACFTTQMSQAMLSETYVDYPEAEPLTGPGWFECFDADDIGDALAGGDMLPFLGEANVVYGIDRVVAIDAQGRGYVWHQINACGEQVFDGKPAPQGCPPRDGTQ